MSRVDWRSYWWGFVAALGAGAIASVVSSLRTPAAPSPAGPTPKPAAQLVGGGT